MKSQLVQISKLTVCTVFTVVAFPIAVHGCSCPVGDFDRSRTEAIRDDFCSQYVPSVYVATVTGATCNCLSTSDDADLDCNSYGKTATSLNYETIGRAACGRLEDYMHSFDLHNCSAIVPLLAGGGSPVVIDTTTMLPMVENTTVYPYETCYFACPFNDQDNEQSIQPCTYTVHVDTVYKGNATTQMGSTLTLSGPDVLTSCGYQGRVLTLGRQYVVGIGGPCSPISEWTELGDYSQQEIQYLGAVAQAYSADPEVVCGATTMASLSLLLLCLTAIASSLV